MKKSAGFTLIEILIALAILAIALVAVVAATAHSVRDTTRVKEKMAAHWVAMNVLSSLQVGMTSLGTEGVGLDGMTNMLGEQWQWKARQIQGAGNTNFIRVGVDVMHQGSEKKVEHLEGFVKF